MKNFVSCCIACAALIAGCGSDDGGSDNVATAADPIENRLAQHIASLPADKSETNVYGPVVSIECNVFRNRQFESEPVNACEVEHEDSTIAIWCVALVQDRIYTNRESDAPELECVRPKR